MDHSRNWIVALDLTERSHGAIGFAKWLRQRSAWDEQLVGVHVTSKSDSRREHPRASFPLDKVQQLAAASVEALQATAEFESVDVVLGDSPEQELDRLGRERTVDGLVLGRAATIDGWSLVSLGRVTRRLLRRSTCPMVVVPPDLPIERLGRGPIIVGVDLSEHALAAVHVARSLASCLDLPLILAHATSPVAAPISASPEAALACGSMAAQVAQIHFDGPRPIDTWLAEHGLGDLPLRTEQGFPGPTLCRLAKEENATAVVCGARRVSLMERIFMSTTGSELAGKADRPVIVVPYRDERSGS